MEWRSPLRPHLARGIGPATLTDGTAGPGRPRTAPGEGDQDARFLAMMTERNGSLASAPLTRVRPDPEPW